LKKEFNVMTDQQDKTSLLFGFVSINLFTGIVVGIFQMIIPLYALSLNASNAEIGLIRGGMGLGMFLTVIPAGFLVDHFGSKRLYLAGSICCTIVIIGVCLAVSPFALMVLMSMYGFFRSLSLIATNAAFFRNLRVMGMDKAAWVNGSLLLGAVAIGPLLGGLLTNFMSYPSIFIMVLALYPIPILCVIFRYRESEIGRTMNDGRSKSITQFQEFKALLFDKSIRQILFAESLMGACSATFSVLMILIIIKTLHLSATLAAVVLTLNGCTAILVVFIAGSLVNRFSTSRLYLTSFTIASFGLFGLSLPANFPIILLSSMILGIGLGFTQLVNYARIGNLCGEKGKVSGLLTAAGGIGFTAGPLLGVWLTHYIEIGFVFAAFIPLFLLLGLSVIVSEAKDMQINNESFPILGVAANGEE
jgi:MFS family permease